MALYNGFSTYNRSKHYRITDFELVKQDITNAFNVRKGEKLMNPNFGSIIWNMLYEPLDENTKTVIMQDIKRIIAQEPRVAAENVVVTQYDKGLQVQIDLLYISTNQRDTLGLNFDITGRLMSSNQALPNPNNI
jgi:phage baseplate assembly protein W